MNPSNPFTQFVCSVRWRLVMLLRRPHILRTLRGSFLLASFLVSFTGSAIGEVENSYDALRAFAEAHRLLKSDQDTALEWLAVGRVRLAYDEARCTTPEVREGASFVVDLTAGDVINYAKQHPREYLAAMRRAQERHDLFGNQTAAPAICAAAAGAQRPAAGANSGSRPVTEWPAIRTHVALELTKAIETLQAKLAAEQPTLVVKGAPDQPGMSSSTQQLPTLRLVRELSRSSDMSSPAWSSDGSKLAVYTTPSGAIFTGGSFAGKVLVIWNANGTVLREITRPEDFYAAGDPLAFVSNDKEIVTPPSSTSNHLAFTVFDVESGAVVREVEGPNAKGGRPDNSISALAVSPDQSVLAVVFGVLRHQPIGLYSTRDWTLLATLPQDQSSIPKTLAFSPDGRLLAVGQLGDDVVLYDVASKQPVRTIHAFPHDVIDAIAFSPDGTLIAIGGHAAWTAGTKEDDPVRVFRVSDGSLAMSYSEPLENISDIDWSRDGRFLAFISGIGSPKLHIWNPLRQGTTESVVEFIGHAQLLAFSPGAGLLAVPHGNKVALYGLAP